MKIIRSTPILVVKDIRLNLEFWEKNLGFEKKVEVPHEDAVGFVLLARDGIEVMLQSRKSIAADLPQIIRDLDQPLALQYIDVDSIQEVLQRMKGIELIVEPRETFYGTREIVVRDPAGFLIVFAEKIK